MPKGIMLGMFTLIALGFLVLIFNPAIPIERTVIDAAGVAHHRPRRVCARDLGRTDPRRLPRDLRLECGRRAGAGRGGRAGGELPRHHLRLRPADLFAIASGLFPAFPVGHPRHPQDPECRAGGRRAARARSDAGGVVRDGRRKSRVVIGGVLLNMAVFGAMFSYPLQGLTFIQLRRRFPNIERPFRSPFGVVGAGLTVIIALVTIGFQLADPVYRTGVIGVAMWYALAIFYFALHGRKRLVLSPRRSSR